ncbi:MAG: CRISPR-associated endoribonuclease Cas6 [Methanosphaera sp.]|nr:CRISPR-associated endoribonuclease Cas6 [Methanosphaera sp.]
MRLLIKFNPLCNEKYDNIGKYDIQGFIYSLLKDTEFHDYHNIHGFKYFTFSNIFPVCDYKLGEQKQLIISSPSSAFIKLLHYNLSHMEVFRLNRYFMEIKSLKLLNIKSSMFIIGGTPIVLYENNIENRYYSFKSSPNFNFFFERLKDNALKKYNSYYNDDYYFEGELFDSFEFNREVSVRMKIHDNNFIVIGSLWKSLEKELTKDNRKFNNFIFDCGLGEKNSLGFGFVNNRR